MEKEVRSANGVWPRATVWPKRRLGQTLSLVRTHDPRS